MKINVLVVEDDPEWRVLIEQNLELASKQRDGTRFEVRRFSANSTREASEVLISKYCHIVSLDQNMRETSDGDVAQRHGQDFALNIKRLAPTVIGAMYTGFPKFRAANEIGAKTGFPYWVKSTKTEGEYCACVDYTQKLLCSFEEHFIRNVLIVCRDSAHVQIAGPAREALARWDRAINGGQNDDVALLLEQLQFLREGVEERLVHMTQGLLRRAGLRFTPPSDSSSSGRSMWLKGSWVALAKDEAFTQLMRYFDEPNVEAFNERFLGAFFQLRKHRNDKAHGRRPYVDLKDYWALFPHLVRVAELAAVIVLAPMMVNPSALHPGYLNFLDLRSVDPQQGEITFSGKAPSTERTDKLFTQLVVGGVLIDLTGLIAVRRDGTGSRPHI